MVSESSTSSRETKVVAIVGGGVSGSLVAAQLLRCARPPFSVILYERGEQVGGGVAYGAAGEGHLLNVPAAKMSALPDAMDDFHAWVKKLPGFESTAPTQFVPRRLYQLYIRDTLIAAQRDAPSGVTLEIRRAEVFDVEEFSDRDGGRVYATDVKPINADAVVLALGNLPGEYPLRKTLPFFQGPRYAHVPWAPDALDGIAPDDEVLLVGQGLTAIDTILTLEQRGHRGVIHALSRRGLRPQEHHATAPYARFLEPETAPREMLALWRRVRAEIRQAAGQGIDWRAVIDSLRPVTPGLWQQLRPEERARFMRHVRPFWEVVRHRVAPEIGERLETLAKQNLVQRMAGSVESLRDDGSQAIAVVRRRGTSDRLTLRVAKVINCSGPRSDYSKFQHPLLINLLSRGLIDHDPLALGLAADAEGNLLRYRGGPVGWLFTLGPPMKGVLWECSAVPEIRVQAAELARKILLDLALAKQDRA